MQHGRMIQAVTLTLMMWAIASAGCSKAAMKNAASIVALGQPLTYPFTSFKSTLPRVWNSRPEVQGSVERLAGQLHDGERIIRLNWDFTAVKNPANNFVNFWWPRLLLGQPLAVKARIYTPPSAVGTDVALWVRDATGQLFISRRTMRRPGWGSYRFPVAGLAAAWKSGAGDNVQHLPLQLHGFAVDWPGHAGYLLLSGIQVISRGPARQFLTCTPMTNPRNVVDRPHFTGWGRAPLCRLHLANYARTAERNLVVTLRASDAITGKVVWEDRIPVPILGGDHGHDIAFTPSIKNGVFNLVYSVSGKGGPLPNASGSVVVARLMGDVRKKLARRAVRLYVRHWGLCGGVMWFYPPARFAATGAAWQRCFANWAPMEPEPGEFDFAGAVHAVKAARHAGLGVVYLATLYTQPPFYHENRASFALAYGGLLKGASTALGSLVQWYELGNEDNGRTKYLYTEVGRNGAAAVRSVDPMAMLGNSATAGVDIGWLEMQARRGLFADLDAIVTHPYTWGNPPETFGLLGQLERVNQFIDKLGGMKFQFTTEFGYTQDAANPEGAFVGQQRRAQWIPRHFAIAAAAGLIRDGLYSWDGDFGIYNNGAPYPAAASVNAFCNFTYASQFAGWWRRDPTVWAVMFARADTPLLMAWSPANRGTLTLRRVTNRTRVYDMYGNPLAEAPTDDRLALHLTGSPIYVTGLPIVMLQHALANAADQSRRRYARNLAASSLRNMNPWKHLARLDSPSLHTLAGALEEWQPSAPTIAPATQAAVAQTVRRLILAAHIAALSCRRSPVQWGGIHESAWNSWAIRLEHSVREDNVDLPAVRWVLEKWRQVHDEAAMCHQLGDDRLAGLLAGLDPVFQHLCAALAVHGPKIFFAAWPYLYQGGQKTPLVEDLRLVTDEPVPVTVRVDSYLSHPYRATVTLKAPPHWHVTPGSWTGRIAPERSRVLPFKITAGTTVHQPILAVLSVPGKPLVRLAYSNFTVLPPLQASTRVVPGPLPQVPLPLEITNNGAQQRSATVRIIQEPSGRPLVAVAAGNLEPGERRTLQIELPQNIPVPAFNRWHLQAELSAGGGKHYHFPLTVDFSGATYATRVHRIGGNWINWGTAAPLHLSQGAYTYGSFANWRKGDLSGVVYTLWDKRYLYLMVHVRSNQPFHQVLSGSAVWQQDSVQLAIAPPHGRRGYVELSLAQTSHGPQVWCYSTNQLVTGARLIVTVKPHLTIYQAAIPWSAMPAIHPVAGAQCRFDILLNKYYRGTRAYMERYGTTIVNGPWNPETMGWLNLLAPAATDAALR